MKAQLYIFWVGVLTCLILSPFDLTAQTDQFVNIPRPNGANGVWLTDIKQDLTGYLWVANPGVARYNGYEWTTYRHNPSEPNSLASNQVEVICPSSDGVIWVGTKGYGLNVLNPHSGEFKHYYLAGDEAFNETDNFISVLVEGQDGTLWIGTHNGLYSRDPADGSFTHYPASPGNSSSLSHQQVRAILEDRAGTIWVGTGDPSSNLQPEEGGLNKLNRETGKFMQFKADPMDPNSLIDNQVRAIFEDSRGNLWIGTNGDGLHTLNRQTGQFTRYPYQHDHRERLSRPYPKTGKSDATYGISFIIEDSTGNIWVGAYQGGLVRYDHETNLVQRFSSSDELGLPNDLLWTACVVQDGSIFFGSSLGQFVKFQEVPPELPFERTTHSVQAMYEDPQGSLWLGSLGGGLSIETKDGLATAFDTKQLELALENTTIVTILESKDQEVWLSTWEKGLLCYNLNDQNIRHFVHNPNDPTSLSPGALGFIFEDQVGNIWVPTEYGLDQMHRKNNTFTHYQIDPLESASISANSCISVLEDFQGTIWVGTGENGINKLDRRTGHFKKYLEGFRVFQIYEDSNRSLWLVTADGPVYRYHRNEDQFLPFHEQISTTPIKQVKSIIEDDQKNLWFGTRTGLVRLDSSRTKIQAFGEAFGFRGGESVYFASNVKRLNGELCFGGIEGYYHFHPDQLIDTKTSKPNLILSSLTIAGQSELYGKFSHPIHELKEINLTHQQSTFSLSFTALEFAAPEKIEYAYKLDNYDFEWHIGKQRTANYYKVPVGEYVFRVKMIQLGQDRIERTVAVNISLPWWQRRWAYAMYLCLLLGLTWGIIQYRSAALRRQNQLLEEKVALRTEQLQNSIGNLKATQSQLIHAEKMASLGELTAGIAHEIQNPLNFVNNFSEVSTELLEEIQEDLEKGNYGELKELLSDLENNLSKIHHHGERASGIVKGMLDHSRATSDEKAPTDINQLCDEYLRLAYHGLRAKNKSFQANFRLEADPNLPEIMAVPQDIGRVLLNLINNGFQATLEKSEKQDKDYKPELMVKTVKRKQSIEIRIIDNGPGIPKEIKDKIFQPFFTTKPTGEGTGLGLSLAYDIVKAHGGEITLNSKKENGTEFYVTLPINGL